MLATIVLQDHQHKLFVHLDIILQLQLSLHVINARLATTAEQELTRQQLLDHLPLLHHGVHLLVCLIKLYPAQWVNIVRNEHTQMDYRVL